jgi:hypothetical protein
VIIDDDLSRAIGEWLADRAALVSTAALAVLAAILAWSWRR